MISFLNIAVKNVLHRKVRSLLTVMGITIGIASVIALITLGNSLTFAVQDQLERLGTDKIFIAAKGAGGASFGPPTGSAVVLTDKDLNAIKKLKEVDVVVPALFASLPVKYRGETQTLSIVGVPAKDSERFFSEVQAFELNKGRFVKDGEKSAVVIGAKVRDDVFEEDVGLRSKLEILGKELQVVGIFKPVGNRQDDASVTMSIEGMRDLTGKKEEITAMIAKVNGDPKKAAEKIEEALADNHNSKDLFTAQTSDQLIERINSVFGAMSIVLSGIAGISLLVAAFGIMNTMLMSVLERTKEIGVMKAVGAKNSHIILLFLMESAMVGLIGGVMGVAAGLGITSVIGTIAQNLIGVAIIVRVDIVLMVFTIAFAGIVGILSGTYPAYKAAKLNPVDALRYE